MREIWRAIPGTDGWYEISTSGHVRSWVERGWHEKRRAKEPHLMKCSLTPKNGLIVMIRQKRFTVKNIVRDVFMGGERPGYVLAHKNGDRSDCSVENLVFVTRKQLNAVSNRSKRKVVKKVSIYGRKVLEFYPSVREAAEKNFLSNHGMTNRIKKKIVVDGVYFCYDR